jgi:hypothetical protein
MFQKEHIIEVQTIRCDNCLENQKRSKDALMDKNTNIKFEFTASNTPQQNGQIEGKFQTHYGKI